jgi:hypothetical protein
MIRPAAICPDARQGQPLYAFQEALGRAAANRWRTTNSSSVRPRNPTDNSRIKLLAWSSRSRYTGVKDKRCSLAA